MPDQEWTQVQVETSASLIGQIAHRWRIHILRQHIIGHREIRTTKTCPGSTIDLDDLIARVPERPSNILDAPKTVHPLANLRLRAGRPSTSAPVVRVALTGTAVSVVGFTESGQPVNGNPCWYIDGEGNYLWAGATDIPDPRQSGRGAQPIAA